MRTPDRLVFLSLGLASLALAGAAYLQSGAGTAALARTSLSEPTVVKVGTCDVFRVTDALLKVEPWDGLLKAEQDKANKFLAPMEQEVTRLQNELQALGQAVNEPGNREKVQTFQRKRDEFFRARNDTQTGFDSAVSRINFEALLAARAGAKATAERLGYSLLIATRALDAAKPPDNPAGFSITALTAPVVHSAAGDDITEQVIADLGVRDPKKASTSDAAPPAPPASEPPAKP